MDNMTAEFIGKKAKALKHCTKLLDKIEKHGHATVKLNCTGVEFVVRKGDAIHLRIQSLKFTLIDEIGSYEITRRAAAAQTDQPIRRTAPAPVGATEEEFTPFGGEDSPIKRKVTPAE